MMSIDLLVLMIFRVSEKFDYLMDNKKFFFSLHLKAEFRRVCPFFG